MPDKKHILLIGSSVMELSLNMYRLPDVGERLTDDGGVAYLPGGADVYTAAALTRLGVPCTFCSCLGADIHGHHFFDFYKSYGISTSCLKVDRDHPTGLSVCLKAGGDGARTVYYPGANEYLTAADATEAFSCQPGALVIGHGVPFAARLAAMRQAEAQRIPIFMSGDGLSTEDEFDLLPAADVFFPDDAAVFALTGLHADGVSASLQVAARIGKKVPFKYLLLSLGARGTFLYYGTRYEVLPPYGSARRTPDMTGIDEAFMAALLLSHVTDPSSIQRSVTFASAAASLAVTKGGGLTAFPTAKELSAYLTARV